MPQKKKSSLNKDDRSRLLEIISILKKNQVQKGMDPQKLRKIFEELGPTFVKAGQLLSMRPELIPPEYCKELENLRTDVAPMPTEEVIKIIAGELEALGLSGHLKNASSEPPKSLCPDNAGSEKNNNIVFDEIFPFFDPIPIGSASIAQVHKAVLFDGSEVAVKVQRPNIYRTMERDIMLIRRLDSFVKMSYIGKVIDLNLILDEMWDAAKHEMDFLIEADNLEEFALKNSKINYVCCPKVYRNLSTRQLLVMEFSHGVRIDDVDRLKLLGYDLEEIGRKAVSNYIKQVIEDRFFQADPHPGNIYISNGKIVWLDMGMMCRVQEFDALCYKEALNSVIDHNYEKIMNVVMDMGVCTEPVNETEMLDDFERFIRKYEKIPLYEINLAVVMNEALDLAAKYKIRMPKGVTMVSRGMATMEGLLEIISPKVSIISVLAINHAMVIADDFDLKKEAFSLLKDMAVSGRDLAKIPAQLSDAADRLSRGKLKINVEPANLDEPIRKFSGGFKTIAAAAISGFLILAAALIYAAAIISSGSWTLTPAAGIICFVLGIVLAVWTLFFQHK